MVDAEAKKLKDVNENIQSKLENVYIDEHKAKLESHLSEKHNRENRIGPGLYSPHFSEKHLQKKDVTLQYFGSTVDKSCK